MLVSDYCKSRGITKRVVYSAIKSNKIQYEREFYLNSWRYSINEVEADSFFTSRKKVFYWTKESCLMAASNYSSQAEFHKNHMGAFDFAKRNGFLNEIQFPTKRRVITHEMAIDICKKYKNRRAVYLGDPGVYKYACTHKLLDSVFGNLQENNTKKIQEERELFIKTALQYKTIKHFCQDHELMYKKIKYRKMEKECFSHMFLCGGSLPQAIMTSILKDIFQSTILTDARKIIPKYELDVYFPDLKLAWEFNGFFWHRNTQYKDQLKIQLCLDAGIELFVINEPQDSLGTVSYYISLIKSRLIELWIARPHLFPNYFSESFLINLSVDTNKLYINEYTLDDIKNAISECSSLKEFTIKYSKYLSALRRLGLVSLVDHIRKIPFKKKNRSSNKLERAFEQSSLIQSSVP